MRIAPASELSTRQREGFGAVASEQPQPRSVWRSKRARAGRTLSRCITEILVDAPRSGWPGIFTPEQIVEIIAIACELPEEDAERPVSHWTPREVAEEAVKRKIVPRISARSVGRFLKSGGS